MTMTNFARVCSTTSAADVCRSLGGAEQLIPELLEQQKDDTDDLKVLPAAVSLIAALLSDGGYPLRARENHRSNRTFNNSESTL